MEVKDIGEAETLIEKYRNVMAAKNDIGEIAGRDGGASETFQIQDNDTGVRVGLYGMKAEIVEGINRVLDERYDKIVSRLKEI